MKTALVTGGSRGLGAAISSALGAAGYRVAVNHVSNADAAETLVKSLPAGSFAYRADVADRAEVASMIAEIKSRCGRLDVLVNNAGVTADALLMRADESDWERVMAVNLGGAYHAIAESVRVMKPTGGHIVNISSRSGYAGNAGQAAYSASKAALLGLTRTMARELGAWNIRVNAIVPAYLPTAMGADAEAAMERARMASALKALGDADEHASFVAWLAGTARITGQIFTLDSRGSTGGW